jgi:hypothetical protein
MNTKLVLISFAIGSTLICGCASSLKTFDDKNQLSVGIPINTPVLVKITEHVRYEVDPKHEEFAGYCKPDINVTYQSLALGERSYIAFNPAPLGKGEFKIEFHENGTLKSVSLNSDAAAGADKVNDVLKTVLPYTAAPISGMKEIKAAGAEETAQKVKEKYCIKKGTEVISAERVEIK